jgi:hypothetical protein
MVCGATSLVAEAAQVLLDLRFLRVLALVAPLGRDALCGQQYGRGRQGGVELLRRRCRASTHPREAVRIDDALDHLEDLAQCALVLDQCTGRE